jgi:hypothetical protein
MDIKKLIKQEYTINFAQALNFSAALLLTGLAYGALLWGSKIALLVTLIGAGTCAYFAREVGKKRVSMIHESGA